MARRRIGQETFAFGSSDAGRRCSLDDLHDLIDWAPIDRRLASISRSARGEPAWPPLALFKAMDKALFDEIATQLKAKAIRVKTGTLVDATIIASASEGDDEARWVKHKGRLRLRLQGACRHRRRHGSGRGNRNYAGKRE
jgi:transposase, IS5 family